MRRQEKGSITVFCSLVFLLVIALIGTMFDLAMWDVSNAKVKRSLECGTYGLTTEYSRPLYKYYKLLFIEDTGESFEQAIAGYMPSISRAANQGVTVSDKVRMTDYDGQALQSEISNVMKYRVATNTLNHFLEDTKELQDSDSEADDLDEKAKEQEEMAEMDLAMLDLMREIDGTFTLQNKVYTKDCFVKKYVLSDITAANLYINNNLVWEKVKPNVKNIIKEYQAKDIQKTLKGLLTCNKDARIYAMKMKNAYDNQTFQDEELKEYAKRMKDFLSSGKDGLVSKLTQNIEVIEQAQDLLIQGEVDEKELKVIWKNYRVDIEFNYDGIGEEKEDSPIDTFKDEYENGILGFVMPAKKKVSKKKIKKADEHLNLYGNETYEEQKDYGQAAENLLDDDEVSLGGTAGKLAEYGLNKFFVDAYSKDFFGDYQSKNDELDKTSLAYEREYLICGNNTDKSNLTSIVNRIILLRTVINAGIIFSSSKMRNLAYTAALAVVGFTGMEPLIRLTQTLIILGWAMEESVVDVAILLAGKTLPIVKRSKHMMVKFTQLLSFSKKLVRTKVKTYKYKSKGLTYEIFLSMFMALTPERVKLYRMMDLMKCNLKLILGRTFQPVHAVHSFKAGATFQCDNKFFCLPFVKELINRDIDAHLCSQEISVSY